MEWYWLILLGLGTGTYGVMVGAGGGFILVPALLILSDLEPAVVAGTVLALVAINTASGAQAYLRMGLVDRRSALLFAGAAIPASVLAPFVLAAVAGTTFRVLFGLLLVALAVQMLVRPRIRQTSHRKGRRIFAATVRSREITTAQGEVYRYEFNEAVAMAFNGGLGFISSFFGTGAGFIRTPVLVSVFNFPVRVAVATSVFAMAFYTAAGAASHAGLGHIQWWPTFVMAGVGLLIGAQIGARLANVVTGPWIMRLLLILILAMGTRLVVQGLWQ